MHRPEVPPPPSSKKYWTRRGIAEWLVERLAEDDPTLVEASLDAAAATRRRFLDALLAEALAPGKEGELEAAE
jgi:hypothetical protein